VDGALKKAEAMTEAPVGIVSDVVSFVEVVLVNTVAAQERRTSQFSPLSKEEAKRADELEARATMAEAM
jgi:hypothetical protein